VMESVPAAVKSWTGAHVIFVFGRYALASLCVASAESMPHAPEVRSHSQVFEIVVFQKSKIACERAVFGGVPVLCYDVQSAKVSSKQVMEHLFAHWIAMSMTPDVWILNAHTRNVTTHGLNVQYVDENDEDVTSLHPVMGRKTDLKKVLQKTNALPVETWQFLEDDPLFSDSISE